MEYIYTYICKRESCTAKHRMKLCFSFCLGDIYMNINIYIYIRSKEVKVSLTKNLKFLKLEFEFIRIQLIRQLFFLS